MSSADLPLQSIRREARYVVIGLGSTGLSCARYLRRRVDSLVLVDTRSEPPGIEQVVHEFSGLEILLGGINAEVLKGADFLIVSPGVALEESPIAEAIAAGVELISDLDLFRLAISCPIVCITGSNGKSTVATLVHEMARACGRKSVLCGNIGVPVLDALTDEAELYVVEASSFQLERSRPLMANAATVLNVSPDHMDRYDSFAHYVAAKRTVYDAAQNCVFNRGDLSTSPGSSVPAVSFGIGEAANDDFGLTDDGADVYLRRGKRNLLNAATMRMKGEHNQLNVLAALAMADAVELDLSQCTKAAAAFPGLEHRCEFVGSVNGVEFINDSKGTNTGATVAAIEGLVTAGNRNIVLLAGGVGKDADFSALAASVQRHVKHALLFGQDANAIALALHSVTKTQIANSLDMAVKRALDCAVSGDIVLFSPACASFDMFNNFEHRGDCYKASVHAVIKGAAQ